MSKVYDLNLGAECLTSKKTKSLYREYLQNDETLRKEIEGKLGLGSVTVEMDMEPIEAESDAHNMEDDEVEDEPSSEIPLKAVIRSEIGFDILVLARNDRFCIAAETVTNVDGVLRAGGSK